MLGTPCPRPFSNFLHLFTNLIDDLLSRSGPQPFKWLLARTISKFRISHKYIINLITVHIVSESCTSLNGTRFLIPRLKVLESPQWFLFQPVKGSGNKIAVRMDTPGIQTLVSFNGQISFALIIWSDQIHWSRFGEIYHRSPTRWLSYSLPM